MASPSARGAPLRVLTPHPDEMLGPLFELLPNVEFVRIPVRGELPADASGEVLLCGARGFPNLEAAVERGVRWIHATGTGVGPAMVEAGRGGRVLTCSRGWSSVPIAEWVLAMMLAYAKRVPDSWIPDAPERWARAELSGLQGRTLGLVGLGTIGVEIARRARAFDMRVVAMRRSNAPSPIEGVEVVQSLEPLLQAEHLVLAAPGTDDTRHLIDAEALRRVRPGVHICNIARGTLIDHDALRVALDDGRVALATLDTPDPDPLPSGHWLYAHPKVRVSPHISWNDPVSNVQRHEIFVDNVRRYLAGEPLRELVDLENGY